MHERESGRRKISFKTTNLFSIKKVKMKLYQLAQASFAILGINSDRSIPFNWRLFIVSLSYGISIVIQSIFLIKAIQTASSFAEYTDSIFVTAATITVGIYFAISVFQRKKFFEFINDCDEIAANSE